MQLPELVQLTGGAPPAPVAVPPALDVVPAVPAAAPAAAPPLPSVESLPIVDASEPPQPAQTNAEVEMAETANTCRRKRVILSS